MNDNVRSITSFLNKEYLEYAYSVLEERAIPSICDGFKPGARKIINASLSGTTKDGKLYKLLALSGDTMRISLYAHGDSSLNSTIVGLCKTFNDNLNPLESDSQVGSLRDPDSAGAPRYLYVKHSKFIDLYKTDYDLLNFIEEEGQQVEPMNYLPIIPTILCKNNIGVAVGYSMRNQAYNPIDVIDRCLEILYGKKASTIIHPYIRGIKQSNWRYEQISETEYGWFSYGEWRYDKDTMIISDLPADTSYEDFEKLLNKLEDTNYIKGWKNLSNGENGIHYEVFFLRGQLSSLSKTDIPKTKFKLIKQVKPDLFWLLDENHKLKYFSDCYDVVDYFVKWRLNIYRERKRRLTSILESKYKNNSDLVKFIELICSGKLIIKNRSVIDIKKDLNNYNLPVSFISSTPISKVTIEERDALLKENQMIKKELDYINKTTEVKMYINDLNDLRKKLINEFGENR